MTFQKSSIKTRLDWLTCSTHLDEQTLINLFPVIKEEPPLTRWYDKTLVIAEFGKIQVSDNPRQKSALTFTGTDMSKMIEAHGNQNVCRRLMGDDDWKVTRIDFAIDVHNASASPRHLFDAWEQELAVTRVRTPPKWLEEGTDFFGKRQAGSGVAFGSRAKKVLRRMRVYDKAAELQDLADIVRVEFVTYQEAAMDMSKDMLERGITSAGRRHITKWIDFPSVKWWHYAMDDGSDYELSKTPRSEPNPLEWLHKSVTPFIRNNAHEHEAELRRWLKSMLREMDEGKPLPDIE